MTTTSWHLQQKRDRLIREINAHLDFISGSLTSQGPRGGFSLTFKENGKTRSRYIRTALVDEVRRRTRRHQKLKTLLKELADVNWELLKVDSES